MLVFNNLYSQAMKNNILRIATAALLLVGCAPTQEVSWWNLPKAGHERMLDFQRGALIVDPHGSALNNMVGELLYVSPDGVVTVENKEGNIATLRPREYYLYKLHIARPSATTAGWSATTAPLLVFTHGWFVALTAPLSWVTSGMNLYSERHAYGLYMNELSIEQIRAQCRFPMGVPEEYTPGSQTSTQEY